MWLGVIHSDPYGQAGDGPWRGVNTQQPNPSLPSELSCMAPAACPCVILD